MLELGMPLALLGLAVIPLIRWLHRFRDQAERLTVASLLPWREFLSDQTQGAKTRRPHPAWRRRAAIVALLSLALAEPTWFAQEPGLIRVWWDFHPSMQTRENDVSRHALALRSLLEAVANRPADRLQLNDLQGLRDPIELDLGLGDIRPAIQDWLDINPPGSQAESIMPGLPDGEANWLISDGSNPALAAWLARQPMERLIQVGQATENLGIEQLALRRSLRDAERFAGQVTVKNPGRQPASLVLRVRADDDLVLEKEITLAPGQPNTWPFAVTRPGQRLVAELRRLNGSEALTLDDRLRIDLADRLQPVPYRISADCADPIKGALAAHPVLTRVTDSAQFLVHCGPTPASTDLPQLWFGSGPTLSPAHSPWSWNPAAGRLRALPLPTDLRLLSNAAAEPNAETWLQRGDRVAIREITPQAGNRRLDILFDLTHASAADGEWLTWLLDELLHALLRRNLLDEHLGVSQTAIDIAPRPLRLEQSGRPAPAAHRSHELTVWLLFPALLLLAWDLAKFRGKAATTTRTPG